MGKIVEPSLRIDVKSAQIKQGINSRKKAINDKCKECIYDPHSGMGTWREQVAACTSYNCPLYKFRPLPA